MSFYPGNYPWNPLMMANPTLSKMYPMVKSPEQMIAQLYCGINSLIDYTNQLSNYYIPQFKGEWYISNKYNPNDLVVDSDGNTWVALKPVPSGTPLTESEYWHIAYPYSQQFDDLTKTVSSFDTRITQANNNASNAVSTANNALNTANNALKSISKLGIKNAKQMNVAFIGDSWTAGYNENSPTSYYGYVDVIKNAGIFKNCYRYSQGGMGYVRGETENSNFSAMADRLISEHENEDIDIIFIFGGLNDLGYATDETMAAAANALFDKLINRFPHSRIVVAANAKDSQTVSQTQMLDIPITIANRKGLAGDYRLGHLFKTMTQFFLSDHYHFNIQGYNTIAYYIVLSLLNMQSGGPLYSYTVANGSTSSSEYIKITGTKNLSINVVANLDITGIYIFGLTSNGNNIIEMPYNYLPNFNETITNAFGYSMFDFLQNKTYHTYLDGKVSQTYINGNCNITITNATESAAFRAKCVYNTGNFNMISGFYTL